MGLYMDRYQQGYCEQVWQDLSALHADIRQVDIYPDAWAVAVETMRRVRYNIAILQHRLEELGYQFGYEWLKEERVDIDEEWIQAQPARFMPPIPDIEEKLQYFEEIAGPLPLSLRAFYHEVGEVNFFGRHPLWEKLFEQEASHIRVPSNLDPLAVEGFHEENVIEDFLAWKDVMQKQGLASQRYGLVIAVDYELKYNVSGSGAYEIEIPNQDIDAPLVGEWHNTTFVNYLRICLHYGGLPGLQYISHLLPNELAYLRKDLLSF